MQPTLLSSSALHSAMSLETSSICSELVHHFNAATGYAGGCTPHQREDAHYERGRKDGLGQALELLDTFVRAEDGHPGRRRTAEEIAGCARQISHIDAAARPETGRFMP